MFSVMFINDAPKTIEEARAYRYNKWAGNPKGSKYQEGRCAMAVWVKWMHRQCSRKAKEGPGNLYCKAHARKFPSENAELSDQ